MGMRCVVVSKHGNPVIAALRKLGLKIRGRPLYKPAYAIVYGGDGAVLHAERVFPDIPKLCIRRSRICRDCRFNERLLAKPMKCVYSSHYLYCHSSLEPCLRALESNRFGVGRETKLEATAFTRRGVKRLSALNEIHLHNVNPLHAVRFSVFLNGKLMAPNVFGDGLVVATPYGSPAYFRSIARKSFSRGIGIAFNNPEKRTKPRVVSARAVIEIVAERNALLMADNNTDMIHLSNKERVRIRKARQKAKFVVLA